MTDHCYSVTPAGHRLFLTVEGESGPILITLHGGGIVNGSRRDEHCPFKALWPGITVAADYRLLEPSSGHEIVADIAALFEFLLSLPIDHHRIFVSGFSGGGYPLRLAAMYAAEESKRDRPRFKVLGWVSYFGMGGDFLLDHWVKPRPLDAHKGMTAEQLEEAFSALTADFEGWSTYAEEVSDVPYTASLSGHCPARGRIWQYWQVNGAMNDSSSGHDGLSKALAGVEYDQRETLIPQDSRMLYPQLYLAKNAAYLPPLLLVHGNQDEAVPYAESLTTLRAIQYGGGQAELVTLDEAGHNLWINGIETEAAFAIYRYTVEWMLRRAECAA